MEPVFVLSGEIDLASRETNLEAAEAFCATATGPVWVVDVTDVSFMDSTGLGLLVQMRSRALPRGATVLIRNPSPRIRKLLHIAGLAELFAVDPPLRAVQSVELPPVPPVDESDDP